MNTPHFVMYNSLSFPKYTLLLLRLKATLLIHQSLPPVYGDIDKTALVQRSATPRWTRQSVVTAFTFRLHANRLHVRTAGAL